MTQLFDQAIKISTMQCRCKTKLAIMQDSVHPILYDYGLLLQAHSRSRSIPEFVAAAALQTTQRLSTPDVWV